MNLFMVIREVLTMVRRVDKYQWVDESDDDDEFSSRSSKGGNTLLSSNEDVDNFKHPPMAKNFPPVVKNFPPVVNFLK